jgi:hypothetical protein
MITLFPVVRRRSRSFSLYRKASKTISFIAVFAVASLIALNQPILALWVGPDFATQSGTLLILHSLTFGMLAVVVVAYQLADGVGLPTFGFWATLCVLFIGLPLMVTLVPYGNLGIAVARLRVRNDPRRGDSRTTRLRTDQTRFWLESGIRLLLAHGGGLWKCFYGVLFLTVGGVSDSNSLPAELSTVLYCSRSGSSLKRSEI